MKNGNIFLTQIFRDMAKVMPVVFGEIKMTSWVYEEKAS